MHRWLHPEIWAGFRKWKRRTWRLPKLTAAARLLWFRRAAPALKRWRSSSRILALGPFMYARLLVGHLRVWRVEAAFHRRRRAARLLFPFRRFCVYIDRLRDLFVASVWTFCFHRVRAAYNKCVPLQPTPLRVPP